MVATTPARIVGGMVCCGLLTAAVLTAQTQSGDTSTTYASQLDVTVVNVHSVVTDKKGRPIEDLVQGDFAVLVDGEPADITNFRLVPGRRAPISPPLALLVFVDLSSSETARREEALTQLRLVLESGLRADDQIMLVSRDTNAIRVLQGFTTDHAAIVAQLQTFADVAPQALRSETEYADIVRELQRSMQQGLAFIASVRERQGQILMSRIQRHTQDAHERISELMNELQALAFSMAGVPGRRAMLYVGGDHPLRTGEALFNLWQAAYGVMSNPGSSEADARLLMGGDDPNQVRPAFQTTPLQELFPDNRGVLMRLADVANTQEIAVYAIDASSQHRSSLYSPQRLGVDVSVANLSAQTSQSPESGLAARVSTDGAMSLLTGTTGGTFAGSSESGDVLEELLQEVTTFYSLGIHPTVEDTTIPHKIEVVVARKGARIRHRETFRIRTQDDLALDRVRSALAFDSVSNELGVQLQLGAPEVLRGGVYTIPLAVRVPMDKVALNAASTSHDAQLSVFIVIQGAEVVDTVQKVVVPFSIPNEDIPAAFGRNLEYHVDLEAPGGDSKLAVGVRDDIAQSMSTLTLELSPARAFRSESGTR